MSFESIYCVTFHRRKKLQFWTNGHIWWGGSFCTHPFTDDGLIWYTRVDTWSTLTCQISSQSVYSVSLEWQKTPNSAIFQTSSFCGVASWWRMEKVEHRCTTSNLPISNIIKIISTLQRLHGEIMHTNSVVERHDKHTDKQTNKRKLYVFGCLGGG